MIHTPLQRSAPRFSHGLQSLSLISSRRSLFCREHFSPAPCYALAVLGKRYVSRIFNPPNPGLGRSAESVSPVRTEEEYDQWAANADMGRKISNKSPDELKVDTETLIHMCQKQVNYWHTIHTVLSGEQIEAVKKIAKLAILNRNRGIKEFVNILHKEKSFDTEMTYLTAQSMFRPLPDSATRGQPTIRPHINEMQLLIRRRLFYVGLLGAHVQSALALWWSFNYDNPAGKVEKEMILRCLTDDRLQDMGQDTLTIANAVKADAAGDFNQARTYFAMLRRRVPKDFDLIWKRCCEYMIAVNEESALDLILRGLTWFPPAMIVHSLEQLLAYTKNERLKIRVQIYLMSFTSRHSPKTIGQSYERIGDIEMAREYYEMAGAGGCEESQVWMREYLEKMVKNSGLWRKQYYQRQLDAWKRFIEETERYPING